MTNHQWTSATVVPVQTANEYWRDTTVDSSTYTDPENTPAGVVLRGYRGAWWTFVSSGNYTQGLADGLSVNNGIYVDVWSRVAGVWTLVAQNSSTTPGWLSTNPQLQTGIQYYVRVGNRVDLGDNPWFQLAYAGTQLPAPVVPVTVDPVTIRVTLPVMNPSAAGVRVNPVRVGVFSIIRIPGEVVTLEADPTRVGVRLPAVMEEIDLVGPVRVGVRFGDLKIVDAALTLTQPEHLETVSTDRPEFIIAVDQRDPDLVYTVELQIDDDPFFASPDVYTADVDSVVGGVHITPTAPVADHSRWRARLLLDGQEVIAWTAARELLVDTTIDATSISVTWTVSPSQAREIHLWHFDPPGPDVGDTVTAYGQGFALTPGHISIADVPIDIQSWTLVPAEADPAVINGNTVDPEHFEVVFIAPDLDGGGPFVVED